MLPISVDVAQCRVMLVGNGEAARRRLALLDEAGATRVTVYAAAPTGTLVTAAGTRLCQRWPCAEEVRGAQLVFLADVGEPDASRVLADASSAAVLINVEDDIARSLFHSPAVLRRGDLTVAVSTAGKSPALAAAVRRHIEQYFGPEWTGIVESLAMLRVRWRAAGEDRATIARRTALWLEKRLRGMQARADAA